jgi:hypothetical protein
MPTPSACGSSASAVSVAGSPCTVPAGTDRRAVTGRLRKAAARCQGAEVRHSLDVVQVDSSESKLSEESGLNPDRKESNDLSVMYSNPLDF